MNLQADILKKYIEVHKKPTLKFIAIDTGIQITRVFRIFNGHEMRVSEYEKFKASIERNLWSGGEERKFVELTQKILKEIPKYSLEEIIIDLDRKIKNHELLG